MNQSLADPNFSCINNDGLAQYAIYDPQLSLLCQECQARERRQNCKTLTLEEAIQKVEDKLSLVETKIDQQVQKLSQLINSAKDFRSQFLTVFDLIIINLESWNESLQHMNKNSYILQELQYLETKQTTLFEKLFTSNNYIYITKLCNRFKEYNFVYQNDQQKFSRLLTQMMKETQIPKLDSQIELIKRQQVPQNDACLNLAFNSSDSIMVSTKGINIQAGSFDKGKINLLQNLGGHEDWVNCIVYSKSKEAFFSGSDDETIRIWKLQNNLWTSSKPFKKHKVYSLLLNSKEDQLFSGGNDHQIIVWKVNLEMNELIQLYQLGKHKCSVLSMSLNQSETLLVSCSKLKSEIIVWENGQDKKMKFKQRVKQGQSQHYSGKKLLFLSENNFIWVTATQEADKIFVFERKNGCFQEKSEQTIELNQENLNDDMFLFPIIKDKRTQQIVVRHKTHIYFLKDFGQGKLKIIQQLNCITTSIYGTITNNFLYLIYWDNKTLGYSVYEIKIVLL
ncbi:unnamed protein product (macronuclear) [Paramecium tetraurelia]|uniref:Uncharacterized protein n=1 Tax=Paramecium tetraurelia TaxID=5888 RepID=A0D1Y3_PARTE|nr:uncharacterized protein GSPATT00039184001 [Paramecium tetraurelia]CAK77050.1 unnamed protein product [Paramecium tetraurelia]|eukprot:XP_001444447.1 hypothetical protein (macronuclear) [Paramecium tetraurelia strain d4-2]